MARSSPRRSGRTVSDPPAPIYNQQSPIDLEEAKAVYHPFDLGQVQFRYPRTQLTGVPEGQDPSHAKVNVTDEVLIPLFGLRLRLLQLHFHAPSEHLFRGVAWPLELHLVHEIQGGQLGATVGSNKLVIAVFFFADADARPREMLSRFGNFFSRRGNDRRPTTSADTILFNPNHCLPDPAERTRFYRYEGSLTSGAFDETVSWLVFERPVPVLEADLLPILQAADQDPRPVQPLNRRTVLRSFP
ncbi:MAG: carbonic anhydrase family protein [Isosphaeraceae bacterium]